MKLISIVIPLFNEENVVKKFYSVLKKDIEYLEYTFEIIFVDDGSCDKTLEVCKKLQKSNQNIKIIALSRNFGHQAAITAGIDYAHGDAIITMDGDLQHPPKLIQLLLDKWEHGFYVVNTVHKYETVVGIFKKITSFTFYKLINLIANVKIKENSADFRLIDKKIADILRKDIRERHRFIRGLVSWIGFSSTYIDFTVEKRIAGKSKYNLSKMIILALDSIVSFSSIPLRFGIYMGTLLGFFSILYGFYAIYMELFTDKTVSGWASILVVITFTGALQFFFIGLIGEYIGSMYEEIKNRPIYIIKDKI